MDKRFQKFVACFVLVCVCVGLSGCQPFRKKFVRKKKEDKKEKFIPVLDPIEYPAKVYTSEEQYKQAYGLWKVWSTEYLEALEENENEKKQKYNLTQSLNALEKMKSFVNDEKKLKFDEMMTTLGGIQSEYDKGEIMRPIARMKSQLNKIMSQVRNELSPKLMAEQYAQ